MKKPYCYFSLLKLLKSAINFFPQKKKKQVIPINDTKHGATQDDYHVTFTAESIVFVRTVIGNGRPYTLYRTNNSPDQNQNLNEILANGNDPAYEGFEFQLRHRGQPVTYDNIPCIPAVTVTATYHKRIVGNEVTGEYVSHERTERANAQKRHFREGLERLGLNTDKVKEG